MSYEQSLFLCVLAEFTMEDNVTKNLTGENTVHSTAMVAPKDLNQHSGLKVFSDGRNCVFTLTSQEVLFLLIYRKYSN